MIVLYFLSIIMALISGMLIKKTTKKLSFITELFAVYLQLTMADVLGGMAIYAFTSRISAAAVISINCALALLQIIVWLKSGRKKQEYYFDRADAYAFAFILLISVAVGICRFGSELQHYYYLNADSCRHLRFCYGVAYDNKLMVNMPYCHIQIGALMECLKPYMHRYDGYRLLELYDLWLLFMSGAAFWCLVKRCIKDKYSTLAGVAFSAFFVLTYPLNSMMDGTIYWGAGCVLVMAGLQAFIELVEDKPADVTGKDTVAVSLNWHMLIRVLAANLAILFCYIQFFPAVIAGEIVYVLARKLAGRLNAKKVILLILGFAAFAVIGVLLMSHLLKADNLMEYLVMALRLDGRVYKNLYADFAWMLPFFIVYIIGCWRRKRLGIEAWVLLFFILHEIAYLLFIVLYKAESYYYFKNYNVIFMLVMYTSFIAFCNERSRFKQAISIYMSVIVILAAAGLMRNVIKELAIRNTINEGIADTIDGVVSDLDIVPLLTTNAKYMVCGDSDVTDDMLEIYKEAGKIAEESGMDVPIVTERWIENEYFYAVSGQSLSEAWDHSMSAEGILADGYYEYFVVDNTTPDFAGIEALTERCELVYANDYAVILRRLK